MGKRITKDIMYDKLDMLKRMSELELDIETSAGRYAVYTSEGHNKLYGRRLSPFGTAKEIWNWMDAFHDGFALGWSACEKKWAEWNAQKKNAELIDKIMKGNL